MTPKPRHGLRTLVWLAGLGLAACATPEPEIVEVTRIVEAEPVEVTVVVTATPVPNPTGGTIVHSGRSDPITLNPILWNDEASRTVGELLFLGLLDLDPYTGEIVGEVAESWEASEDGLTYTFTLREGVEWSDGSRLTAQDFKFTYDAILSEDLESPLKSELASIESVEVSGDGSLEIIFSEADCSALQKLRFGILPAHAYDDDTAEIANSSENLEPSIVSGPFIFHEWVPGEHVALARNDNYYLGASQLNGWTYRVMPDEKAAVSALLNGDVDILGVQPESVSSIEGQIAMGGPLAIRRFPTDRYDWIALNTADPANPQPGFEDLDEDGAYTEGEPALTQDPHPILRDLAVRQAIAHSADFQNIVNRARLGQGVPIPSNVLPSIGWAFDDTLAPLEFNLEEATAILDKAGWELGADGVRSKEGQPLSLTLETNAENAGRQVAIELIRDALNSIGFDITTEVVEFTVLADKLQAQTYDMVLLGWPSLGADPDQVGRWEYRYDVPGSGLNVTSYYNEAMETIAQVAKALPGCDPEARSASYKEIQKILQDDSPFVFLYSLMSNISWNTRVQGIDPGSWSMYHNIHDWFIVP
jgi:peptide/nickel transport system substrate-binding protein